MDSLKVYFILYKSLQRQQIRSSILKFSNRPVSILIGATPHLNLANALRVKMTKLFYNKFLFQNYF